MGGKLEKTPDGVYVCDTLEMQVRVKDGRCIYPACPGGCEETKVRVSGDTVMWCECLDSQFKKCQESATFIPKPSGCRGSFEVDLTN